MPKRRLVSRKDPGDGRVGQDDKGHQRHEGDDSVLQLSTPQEIYGKICLLLFR